VDASGWLTLAFFLPLLAALWVLAGAAIVSVIILLRDAWRE